MRGTLVNLLLWSGIWFKRQMLYQGIMILLHAGHRSDGMTRGIAFSIALAAGTELIHLFTGKGWRIRSAVLLIICMVLIGMIYFYPGPAGFALRYLIALSVLVLGITNIAQTLHFTHSERFLRRLRERKSSLLSAGEMSGTAPKMVQEKLRNIWMQRFH